MSIRLTNEMGEQDKRTNCLNELKKQLDNISQIKKVESGDLETDEQPIFREDNENYREPLSIELKKEIRILLSYGGPEDGFKLTFSQDNELLYGVYYCADWGQYHQVDLNEDELNEIYDFYLYSQYPTHLE